MSNFLIYFLNPPWKYTHDFLTSSETHLIITVLFFLNWQLAKSTIQFIVYQNVTFKIWKHNECGILQSSSLHYGTTKVWNQGMCIHMICHCKNSRSKSNTTFTWNVMKVTIKLRHLSPRLRSNVGFKCSRPMGELFWMNWRWNDYYQWRGRCGGGAAPSATNKFGRAEGTRPNLFSSKCPKKPFWDTCLLFTWSLLGLLSQMTGKYILFATFFSPDFFPFDR